jgi:hypothetical protein
MVWPDWTLIRPIVLWTGKHASSINDQPDSNYLGRNNILSNFTYLVVEPCITRPQSPEKMVNFFFLKYEKMVNSLLHVNFISICTGTPLKQIILIGPKINKMYFYISFK